MLSGLCLQTKPLRVTPLAEFAAEQSHEMGRSQSQKLWLFKTVTSRNLPKVIITPAQWQNWTCPGAADAH